jgi:hypothetical protein
VDRSVVEEYKVKDERKLKWDEMGFPKEHEDPREGAGRMNHVLAYAIRVVCAYAVSFGSGRLADVNEL